MNLRAELNKIIPHGIQRDGLNQLIKNELVTQMASTILNEFGDTIDLQTTVSNSDFNPPTIKAELELDVTEYKGYNTGGYTLGPPPISQNEKENDELILDFILRKYSVNERHSNQLKEILKKYM